MYALRYFTDAYFPGRYFPPVEDAEQGAGLLERRGGSTRRSGPSRVIDVSRPVFVYEDDEAFLLALLLLAA
jgi:hypothetical protein